MPRLALAIAVAAWGLLVGDATAGGRGNCKDCKATAKLALQSALAAARSDYLLNLAKASTLPPEEQGTARDQAREDLEEHKEEAREQHEARVDLCDRLAECRYDPVIVPGEFLSPEQTAANPNPYLPLVPGTTRRYRAETEDGTEIIEVVVTHDTKEIQGVTCIVVRDTVWLNGELKEDTDDWFAQHMNGDVWYFGERSFNYEDGEISDLEGSWEAGLDGAKAGIVMKGNPQVGDVYRQEFLLGEAEDAGEVLALDQSVTVPHGTFDNCLQTADFTPLEPDAFEHKFYAAGVGLVLEVDPESGERVELIAIEVE
jgi:hypothetical protein